MYAAFVKCSKIRCIARLQQMLRRWRKKARMFTSRIPSDVPVGHVTVCVGKSCRRFVVRVTYLNHPVFKNFLVQAEEEYGFSSHGPLTIPCDEFVFEEVIRFISRSEWGHSGRIVEYFKKKRHSGINSKLDLCMESRPLLLGFYEKTV